MIKVCPNPIPWNDVSIRLISYYNNSKSKSTPPPKPLILNGWAYTNDTEKIERWKETIKWAKENNCLQIIESVKDNDYYYVDEPTTYQIGPMGGPMYRQWDFQIKQRPDYMDLKNYFEILINQWEEIAGLVLSPITIPIAFTGSKCRRLLIQVENNTKPPWGSWVELSHVESERRTFTKFRESINKAIKPHEVDHIDFIYKEGAEPAH